jgi:hypothetical protein
MICARMLRFIIRSAGLAEIFMDVRDDIAGDHHFEVPIVSVKR